MVSSESTAKQTQKKMWNPLEYWLVLVLSVNLQHKTSLRKIVVPINLAAHLQGRLWCLSLFLTAKFIGITVYVYNFIFRDVALALFCNLQEGSKIWKIVYSAIQFLLVDQNWITEYAIFWVFFVCWVPFIVSFSFRIYQFFVLECLFETIREKIA